MVAPTYTPCCQLKDSYTSGATLARRAPKITAEMGTPFGFSHSGEMLGHCDAGAVKRLFGCAAFYYLGCHAFTAAARYDYLDLNTDTSGDSGTQTSLGINRFIEKHNAKLQLNYVMCGEETTAVDNDIIRFVVQVSF